VQSSPSTQQDKTMKNDIRIGDTVALDTQNGLGRGSFVVLAVDLRDIIHQLHVRGKNGQTWWARAEGAKVVAR